MSTISIGVNLTQLDAEDQRTIRFVCDQENKRRTDASVELLDFSTGSLRKAYYETLLAEGVKELHKRNVARAARENDGLKAFQDMRDAWGEATDEQRAAALKALTPTVPG